MTIQSKSVSVLSIALTTLALVAGQAIAHTSSSGNYFSEDHWYESGENFSGSLSETNSESKSSYSRMSAEKSIDGNITDSWYESGDDFPRTLSEVDGNNKTTNTYAGAEQVIGKNVTDSWYE